MVSIYGHSTIKFKINEDKLYKKAFGVMYTIYVNTLIV